MNAAGGEESVASIKDLGGESTFVHADVPRATGVEAMIKRVVEVYGRLDCAYNNAGAASFVTGHTMAVDGAFTAQ